jgi:LPPG:FO 2-phospho-L-lactate transferase
MASCKDAPVNSSAGVGHIVALCGGVGGAKLAAGLAAVTDANRGRLTVAVNTGDDFEHIGLHISPDIDTVLYTLAGLSDPVRGWGRADESWHFMAALEAFGGEHWFALGDRDLALHVERKYRLLKGETLSEVTAALATQCGVRARLIPMSDDPVRTIVHTQVGALPFQHYFVKHRCQPRVREITFDGAASARANPALLEALADPQLAAIIICPSNPYLSIDPILAVPGIREALHEASAPIVAVSPIVGGEAVKGPTAKIMTELGIDATAMAIAQHYRGLLDGYVIDQRDATLAGQIAMPLEVAQTLMHTAHDKRLLAQVVLRFADSLTQAMHAGSTECAR